jgi:hypothetical protein
MGELGGPSRRTIIAACLVDPQRQHLIWCWLVDALEMAA